MLYWCMYVQIQSEAQFWKILKAIIEIKDKEVLISKYLLRFFEYYKKNVENNKERKDIKSETKLPSIVICTIINAPV